MDRFTSLGARIDAIASLPANWDGLGAIPIPDSVKNYAHTLLSIANGIGRLPQSIVPVTNAASGIGFTWYPSDLIPLSTHLNFLESELIGKYIIAIEETSPGVVAVAALMIPSFNKLHDSAFYIDPNNLRTFLNLNPQTTTSQGTFVIP